MTANPTTTHQECDENCSTCSSGQAQSAPKSAPKGLPPKAKIDVKHVILVLSEKGLTSSLLNDAG
jgi:hypothetical protein